MPSVFVSNEDDFISPSQACINPLFTDKPLPSTTNRETNTSKKTTTTTDNLDVNVERTAIDGTIVRRRRRKRVPLSIPSQHTSTITATKGGNERNSVTKGLQRPALSYDTEREHPIDRPSPSLLTPSNNNPMMEPTKATVSVADCLACSGCVTSSEAVLITTQHSVERLLRKCQEVDGRIVFTVSPAVIVDLTRVVYPLPSPPPPPPPPPPSDGTTIVYRKLSTFLHREFRAGVVLDGSLTQITSLQHSANEFCRRYRCVYPRSSHHHPSHRRPNPTSFVSRDNQRNSVNTDSHTFWNDKLDSRLKQNERDELDRSNIAISTPSVALSATRTRYLIRRSSVGSSAQQHSNLSPKRFRRDDGTLEGIEISHGAGIDPRLPFLRSSLSSSSSSSSSLSASYYAPDTNKQRGILPMLASSCPGFVCYVEKTAPNLVPYLCTVKSPMAIAGSILKHTDSGGSSGGRISGNDHDDHRDLQTTPASIHSSLSLSKVRNGVFHVAIMPCHDKKLEAGRNDLAWERERTQKDDGVGRISTNEDKDDGGLVPDVDLVITTDELVSALVAAVARSGGEGGNGRRSGGDAMMTVDGDGDCVMKGTEDGAVDHTDRDGIIGSNGDNSFSLSPTRADSSQREQDFEAVRAYFDNLPLAPIKLWGTYGTNDIVNDDVVYFVTKETKAEKEKITTFAADGRNTVPLPPTLTPAQTMVKSDPKGFAVGSGGYAEYIFRYACRALFGFVIDPATALPWRRVVSSTIGDVGVGSGVGGAIRRRRRMTRLRSSRMDGSQPSAVAAFEYCEVLLYRLGGSGEYCLQPTTRLNDVADDGEGAVKGSQVETGVADDQVVLRFAIAYGFKNLQLIQQRLTNDEKRFKEEGFGRNRGVTTVGDDRCYHYVETMACPSGCANGGGQIKAETLLTATSSSATNTEPLPAASTTALQTKETPAERRARVKRVLDLMGSSWLQCLDGEDAGNAATAGEAGDLLLSSSSSAVTIDRLIHTRFHVVPKLELTTGATAGVALEDTKW